MKKYFISFFSKVSRIIILSAFIFLIFTLKTNSILQASLDKPDIKPSAPSDIQKIQNQEERRQKAMEVYKSAMEYSNSREYDKAIQEFQKALEIDPNFAEAHLNLGWTHALKRGDYNIALRETLEAIRLKPDIPIAFRNLWWIYRLLKEYDKAFEALKKIVEIEPDNSVNYINLGDAYVSDKLSFDLAVKAYQKGLELDPNNIFIHRKLAKAYEYQKKYDLAHQEFSKAIKLNPSDAYSYLFLAVSLGKAGKQDEIKPLLKKADEELTKIIPVPGRWDMKLLKFYSGKSTEEEILQNMDPYPIHKCQALYYVGMKYIWEGNKTKGKALLEEAESLKVEALSEYEYAKTELKLLESEQKKQKK